jgi:hypothetical protein
MDQAFLTAALAASFACSFLRLFLRTLRILFSLLFSCCPIAAVFLSNVIVHVKQSTNLFPKLPVYGKSLLIPVFQPLTVRIQICYRRNA